MRKLQLLCGIVAVIVCQYAVLANAHAQIRAAATQLGVQLTWTYTQSTPLAVKFRVYRQSACTGTFAQITETVDAGILTYTDTNVARGETHCWRITAVSSQGGESIPSNTVSFQIQALPAAPANLAVILVGQ